MKNNSCMPKINKGAVAFFMAGILLFGNIFGIKTYAEDVATGENTIEVAAEAEEAPTEETVSDGTEQKEEEAKEPQSGIDSPDNGAGEVPETDNNPSAIEEPTGEPVEEQAEPVSEPEEQPAPAPEPEEQPAPAPIPEETNPIPEAEEDPTSKSDPQEQPCNVPEENEQPEQKTEKTEGEQQLPECDEPIIPEPEFEEPFNPDPINKGEDSSGNAEGGLAGEGEADPVPINGKVEINEVTFPGETKSASVFKTFSGGVGIVKVKLGNYIGFNGKEIGEIFFDVFAIVNGSKKRMDPLGKGEYLLSLTELRNYNVSEVIITKKEKNKEIIIAHKDVGIVLSVYDEEEEKKGLTASFLEIEDSDDDIWYSSSVMGEEPYISFRAETVRYIKSVALLDNNGNPLKNGFKDAVVKNVDPDKNLDVYNSMPKNIFEGKIPFTGVDGKYTYKLKFEFLTKEDFIFKENITVKIDNTAPDGKVSATIDTNGYEPPKVEDKYYTNRPVNIVFEIDENCDSFGEVSGGCGSSSGKDMVSGFRGLSFGKTKDNAAGLGASEGDETKPDLEFSGAVVNGKLIASKGIPATAEEREYEFSTFKLFDKAGNTRDTVAENKEPLKVVYDNNRPQVEYPKDFKNKLYRLSENELVLSGTVSGKIVITDKYLDKNSVLVGNALGKEIKIERINTGDAGSDEYNFQIDKDGTYKIKTVATDYAGNKEENSESKTMIVDSVGPQINVTCTYAGKNFTPVNADETFVTQNATINLVMTEKYPDFENCVLLVTGKDSEGNEIHEELKGKAWKTAGLGTTTHTLSYSTKIDGEYNIKIVSSDVVENKGDEYEFGFTVDSKNPKVNIEFDNNDKRNEKYYNKQRIATITVTEVNFDKDLVKLDLHEEHGKSRQSEWSDNGNIHTKTITFSEDGKYSFSISCRDKANLPSEEEKAEEFIIDQTEPKIEVKYDGGTPKNEFYYNKARAATIEINEYSFDDKLVKMASMPLEGASALPKIAGFSSSDDINKSKLSFNEDGTYGFTIQCTDLAGNESKLYVSDKFVIDTKEPEISFEGVENYSANNGTVAPIMKCLEKNVDENFTKITISGANRGEVSQGSNVTNSGENYEVAFADFAHTKDNDDLYTVEVKVVDKAGNESSDKLVFSVNRFGSVFVLNDAAKELNEQFYTTKAREISITEINVDNIVKKDVTVACDGDYGELKAGKNLKITKEGTDETWKRYTYTIAETAFERDGIYAIGVSTVDRATNVQDSRTRDAAIDFALDRTKPSIVTPDLKSGMVYEGKSHKVNMNISDNMGVKSVKILSDDKEFEKYDSDVLTKSAGNVTFTIKADEKPHDIRVISTDVAGNTNEVVYEDIFVGSKKNAASLEKSKTTDIEDEETPVTGTITKKSDKENYTNSINSSDNKKTTTTNMRYFYYLVAAGLTIGAGAGTGLLIVRRKKFKVK